VGSQTCPSKGALAGAVRPRLRQAAARSTARPWRSIWLELRLLQTRDEHREPGHPGSWPRI